MSDSVRAHRQQPTRLPRPWDSPGKNTRVGCHFFLQCMKVKSESEVAQSCLTLSNPMDCRLLHPWDFPGKSIGVGCHCLLQRVQRLFYTSVSLLLSCIQGYHYHLSKFHIYVLVYYIGVFLSGLLHSV